MSRIEAQENAGYIDNRIIGLQDLLAYLPHAECFQPTLRTVASLAKFANLKDESCVFLTDSIFFHFFHIKSRVNACKKTA